jgi:hypothetical protein
MDMPGGNETSKPIDYLSVDRSSFTQKTDEILKLFFCTACADLNWLSTTGF